MFENCLKKIGLSLGTLMDIDAELFDEYSYLYARLQITTIILVPKEILLCVEGEKWVQSMETEEDKDFFLKCRSRI